MLKIAICDDEQSFINIMVKLIKKTFSDNIEILDTYTSPIVLLNSGKSYDLLFLDIDMPRLNGIELARHYDKNNTSIIFVTNKEALVFEAYNSTDSVGFIRKGRLTEDFESVIKRFNRSNQLMHFLTVTINSQIYKIRLSDIIYIEKMVNSIIIHTTDKTYTQRNTLAEIEEKLHSHGFIRVHAGYIVNLDHILRISSNEITLSDSGSVPVSRNRLKYVKTEFLKRSAVLNE